MATTKLTSPDLFNLESLNTALQLPSGTTAERPASPSTGEWRYNTTTNLIEFYDGGEWRDLQSEEIPAVPSENFNTVLYTGNGGTQSITGVGFKPDFVWLKNRSLGSYAPRAFDSTRGATKRLQTSSNAIESTEATSLTSFDVDGFSVGSDPYVNNSGSEFVAWCWKAKGGTTTSNGDGTITTSIQANVSGKFSIISYTGNGNTGQSIGHGLGVKPEIVILKALDSTQDWQVFGDTLFERMQLNNDGSDDNNFPLTYSSTTVTLPQGGGMEGDPAWNGSGNEYIVYAFASSSGYSKFGSYTGTGSATNRPIINTGFEPAFVMIKNATTADDWMMHDNKRNPSNPRDRYLRANTGDAEGQFAEFGLDFLTNGFQVGPTTNNNWNGSGQTYIYHAFAADPSAAPVLANSFGILSYTGNSSGTYPTTSSQDITGLGFQPQHAVVKRLDNTGSWPVYDILRGDFEYYYWNSTSANGNTASTTNPGGIGALSDGIKVYDDGAGNYSTNAPGGSFIGYAWKVNVLPTINNDGDIQSLVSVNQAAGMSVVKYTGTGSNATVGHGLGVAPNLVITKTFDAAQNWLVGTDAIGFTKYLELNDSRAEDTASTVWNDTAPTSTVVNFGTSSLGNGSATTYIMYCFASIAGFSKIGSYTGVSSGVTITTGFRPSLIIIKSSSNVENWAVLDTTRGSGRVVNPNLSSAESNSTLNTFTVSDTGFSLPDQNVADAMLNENGYEYIYFACRENPSSPTIPAGEMAYMVLAGGASGGSNGGGGGAGGLRSSYGASGGGSSAESNITLSAGTYTITVGGGGASIDNTTSYQSIGNAGTATTISGNATVNTVGGGGGGSNNNPAASGGCGGGSGSGSGGSTGGAGTAGEGFAGGNGMAASHPYTGGGGGATGTVGANASSSAPGNGGFGLTLEISGSSVAYGGGGGGTGGTGVGYTGPGGAGGDGGGGAGGAYNGSGTAGTANTGGGGGATGDAGSFTSGAGGSGVVILRMNTSDYSGTTTGSPTVTTVGSETILTYTGSGTYVHS